MTIRISRELLLPNFERLDILCAWIGHPSEKLWPFEFLESFRCYMSSVPIYYAPKSDFRVRSHDNLNSLRTSVVKFRASRYIMHLNRIPEWKVMPIWISRELLLPNFKRLDILYAWIGQPSEKLRPFEFLESFRCSISSISIFYAPKLDIRVKIYDHLNFLRASVVQFRAFPNIIWLKWTSEWKVMTIWSFQELPLFNFERLDIFFNWIGHANEKLRPF